MASRLERLLRMAEELRRGTYPNVDALCRQFEVKPRTVFADLRQLKDGAGLAVEFDRRRNGYFIKDGEKRLLTFDVSVDEMIVLMVAQHMLAESAGSSFEQILRSAIDKIYQRLATQVQETVARVSPLVTFSPADRVPLSWKVFLDVLCAAAIRRQAEIRLKANAAPDCTIVVEPRLIVCEHGRWFLQCAHEGDVDGRRIAMESIAFCRMLPEAVVDDSSNA